MDKLVVIEDRRNEMRLQYNHSYDDIIHMPHHQSKKHPAMSLYVRSAQFAPFAALTGYEDAVRETARETSERIEIDEELKEILDMKLQLLHENLNQKQEITFTYFVPDLKKEGGEYITEVGIVKKIDFENQVIILANQKEISISEIIDISGKMFQL